MRKLTASNGMVLTNGIAYGREIYLGVNDAPENWWEITEEEYKEAMEKMESEPATEDDYQNALSEFGVRV